MCNIGFQIQRRIGFAEQVNGLYKLLIDAKQSQVQSVYIDRTFTFPHISHELKVMSSFISIQERKQILEMLLFMTISCNIEFTFHIKFSFSVNLSHNIQSPPHYTFCCDHVNNESLHLSSQSNQQTIHASSLVLLLMKI